MWQDWKEVIERVCWLQLQSKETANSQSEEEKGLDSDRCTTGVPRAIEKME